MYSQYIYIYNCIFICTDTNTPSNIYTQSVFTYTLSHTHIYTYPYTHELKDTHVENIIIYIYSENSNTFFTMLKCVMLLLSNL